MDQIQAQKVLALKVDAALKLLNDIRQHASEYRLTAFIPGVNVGDGTDYSAAAASAPPSWESSSEDSWYSSSSECY